MFKSRGQKMCFSTFKCHVLLFRQLGTYLVVDCKLLRVLLLTYIVEFSTKRQQDKIPDNPQLICKQGIVYLKRFTNSLSNWPAYSYTAGVETFNAIITYNTK